MIIDNIKSNQLKIDNCSKGMQFAVSVHYKTISIFWAHCSTPGEMIMRPLTFLYPTYCSTFIEAFSNVNLDKFSIKFSKNLTPCPNFIQIKKKLFSQKLPKFYYNTYFWDNLHIFVVIHTFILIYGVLAFSLFTCWSSYRIPPLGHSTYWLQKLSIFNIPNSHWWVQEGAVLHVGLVQRVEKCCGRVWRKQVTLCKWEEQLSGSSKGERTRLLIRNLEAR